MANEAVYTEQMLSAYKHIHVNKAVQFKYFRWYIRFIYQNFVYIIQNNKKVIDDWACCKRNLLVLCSVYCVFNKIIFFFFFTSAKLLKSELSFADGVLCSAYNTSVNMQKNKTLSVMNRTWNANIKNKFWYLYCH